MQAEGMGFEAQMGELALVRRNSPFTETGDTELKVIVQMH